MTDVVFILLTLAFFAAAAGLVVACDHIIGRDNASEEAVPAEDTTEERAA